MEHHYSLTGRMLAIFVGGLILLAVLIFAAGLLAGRDWAASEAGKDLRAAPPANAAAPAPAQAPAQAPAASSGAIRPADAAPPAAAAPAPPAAPALPKMPKAPKAPAVPKLPKLSSAPATPMPMPMLAKSVGASDLHGMKLARSLSADLDQLTERKSAAPERDGRAAGRQSELHGYVVYVGAFESGTRAENLAEILRRRNLDARTGEVQKPGRKPLVTVFVGPYSARAGAEAALPDIRAAGLDETMIRQLP